MHVNGDAGLRSRHVAYGRLESASNMGIGRENIEQLFVVITPMPQDVVCRTRFLVIPVAVLFLTVTADWH